MSSLLPNIQDATSKFFKDYITRNKLGYISQSLRITHFWYQQYITSNFHGWHIHANHDFSMVYYVELPKDAPATMFRNVKGEEFICNAKEGDLLIFPSNAVHCSPKNESKGRKTIISLNIQIEDS